MHGFVGLNLDSLIGYELETVGVGHAHAYFDFANGMRIATSGLLEVHNNKKLVAACIEDKNWTSTEFVKLLNIKVTQCHVISERVFGIFFANGMALHIHDDSDQYDTVSISYSEPNKPMIVI